MTLIKKPTRNGQYTPSRLNPLNRFFKNDFIDFWDGDTIETVPSINITEGKNSYKIEMAAPGLKKEDFNIDVDGNLVTISCKKESENKNDKDDSSYSRVEYSYSSFVRSFTVPEYVDTARIAAKYTDGILNLNIPKKPEAQKHKSQKIKVE